MLMAGLRLEPNASPRDLPYDFELWEKLQKAHQCSNSRDALFGHGLRKAFEAP